MSWSGTVTCSHCYQRGHNKRKCPSLTAQIKSQYEGNMLAAASEREQRCSRFLLREIALAYVCRREIVLAHFCCCGKFGSPAERM